MSSWHYSYLAYFTLALLAMSKEPYPSETADRFIVRFPEGMRDRLKAIAAENGRSLNAEIVYRLQTTLEMDDFVPHGGVRPDEPMDHAELIGIVRAEVDRMNRVLKTLIEDAADPSSPLNQGRGQK